MTIKELLDHIDYLRRRRKINLKTEVRFCHISVEPDQAYSSKVDQIEYGPGSFTLRHENYFDGN